MPNRFQPKGNLVVIALLLLTGFVGALAGAALFDQAISDNQEAKIHKETINEVSKSFDGEIAPQVVEMEGLQVKLEGNIQNQFDQWQTILADIYESESSQTNEFEIL